MNNSDTYNSLSPQLQALYNYYQQQGQVFNGRYGRDENEFPLLATTRNGNMWTFPRNAIINIEGGRQITSDGTTPIDVNTVRVVDLPASANINYTLAPSGQISTAQRPAELPSISIPNVPIQNQQTNQNINQNTSQQINQNTNTSTSQTNTANMIEISRGNFINIQYATPQSIAQARAFNPNQPALQQTQQGTQNTQNTAQTPAVMPPTVNLQPGSTNTGAVRQLQDYLVSIGAMTQAQVNTGYGIYGPQTTAAVNALQQRLGVDNSTGPGFWGPRTMSAVSAQSSNQGNSQNINIQDFTQTADGFVNNRNGQVFSNEQFANMVAPQIAGPIVNSGQTVDPVQYALVDFRDFMSQASGILDPYYRSQFEQTRNVVSTQLGRLSQDLEKKTGELGRQTDETLRTGRETLAERGLTFSGQRNTFDTKVTDELNRGLELANTTAYRSGQDLLTTAESRIGTSNLQGLNTNIGGRNLSFGNNVLGDLQYQQTGATDTFARQLASDENQRRQYAFNLQNTSF